MTVCPSVARAQCVLTGPTGGHPLGWPSGPVACACHWASGLGPLGSSGPVGVNSGLLGGGQCDHLGAALAILDGDLAGLQPLLAKSGRLPLEIARYSLALVKRVACEPARQVVGGDGLARFEHLGRFTIGGQGGRPEVQKLLGLGLLAANLEECRLRRRPQVRDCADAAQVVHAADDFQGGYRASFGYEGGCAATHEAYIRLRVEGSPVAVQVLRFAAVVEKHNRAAEPYGQAFQCAADAGRLFVRVLRLADWDHVGVGVDVDLREWLASGFGLGQPSLEGRQAALVEPEPVECARI